MLVQMKHWLSYQIFIWPIIAVWFSRRSTQNRIDLSVSVDVPITFVWGPQEQAVSFCFSVIRWLRFCLSTQLNQAFHGLFRRPTCFLWHPQMNAIGQFVFHKDYVVRGATNALIRPHLLPSNQLLQLSCSSVRQPTWCLFMGFIGSLYCAQWSLNLYN